MISNAITQSSENNAILISSMLAKDMKPQLRTFTKNLTSV